MRVSLFVSASVFAALLAIPGGVLHGDGQAWAEDAMVGEILDLACYIPKNAKGPQHKRCAQTCAEHGMPLGLLTDDGSVYLLYPRHGKESAFDAVKKLAGSRASIKGKTSERSGIKGLEVYEAVAAD